MKKLVEEHSADRRSTAEDRARLEQLEIPHHLHEWIEKRVGKPIDEITLEDLRDLPRRDDLHYADVTSPLGGRKAAHLRHLEADEAADLDQRGKRFLEDTPDEDLAPEDLEEIADEHLIIERH